MPPYVRKTDTEHSLLSVSSLERHKSKPNFKLCRVYLLSKRIHYTSKQRLWIAQRHLSGKILKPCYQPSFTNILQKSLGL